MLKNNTNIYTKNNNKFTNDTLKEMQSWDLDRKIATSLTRIAEFYNYFPHKIIISFSGGKDSTVLLHLVRRLYPDTPAVFVDTGLEYPELREFVKTIDNVIWLKPEMNFRDVIKNYGYPIISKEVSKVINDARSAIKNGKEKTSYAVKQLNGEYINPKTGLKSPYNKENYKFLFKSPYKISSKCCDIMKKKPIKKFEKESGYHSIIGTMACESRQRQTQWLKYGCNAFKAINPSSKPLSFWTEQDILEYITRYNLSYASVYGEIKIDESGKYYTTGCNRTGCVFCMYGCHLDKEPTRFQRLKNTHPKIYEYCMKSWNNGGLGLKDIMDYINENGNLRNKIKY